LLSLQRRPPRQRKCLAPRQTCLHLRSRCRILRPSVPLFGDAFI
jgi:hypothetical protein